MIRCASTVTIDAPTRLWWSPSTTLPSTLACSKSNQSPVRSIHAVAPIDKPFRHSKRIRSWVRSIHAVESISNPSVNPCLRQSASGPGCAQYTPRKTMSHRKPRGRRCVPADVDRPWGHLADGMKHLQTLPPDSSGARQPAKRAQTSSGLFNRCQYESSCHRTNDRGTDTVL